MLKRFLFFLLLICTIAFLSGCRIEGRVTSASGEPLEGVLIVLSGDADATTTTDVNGEYFFEMPEEEATYTITPSLSPFNFTPEQRTVTLDRNNQDVAGVDFSADEHPVIALMTFNYISPGTFTMGVPPDELGADRAYHDETQHEVTLTKGFYMQTTEVTQAQWKAVMAGANPSTNSGCNDCPVETVSRDEVQVFIDKLNSYKAGVYRLPTEAEWEYACRAGSTTALANGELTGLEFCTNLDLIGWYGPAGHPPNPVAAKIPNAWGLYDMHGNVWELCQDWAGDYPAGPVTDPVGPLTGTLKIYRGGGSYDLAHECRSGYRAAATYDRVGHQVGFRLVKE